MNDHDYVSEYYEAITSGEVLAPQPVIQIFTMLADEIRADTGRWRFDPALGNRPREFSKRFIKHTKGRFAGKPFVYSLWESAVVQAVFGFVDRETGHRRFTEVAILMPRKQGKSMLAASLCIFMAIADHEAEAEVYNLASTFQQADEIIFAQVRACISKNATLRKRFKKRRNDMYDSSTGSKIEPLAALKPDSLDGKNGSFIVLDECFAIRNPDLWATMRQSVATREQPLVLCVSSAGSADQSLYCTQRTYGLRIAHGDLPLSNYLPIIYEADAEKWESEEEWHRANPSLGECKSLRDMREKYQRAKEIKTDEVSFKSKDLGILAVNSAVTWLDFEELSRATTSTWSIEDFRGAIGIGGVDLSLVGDLTSACVMILRDGVWYFFHHYWLPRNALEEHCKKDKIPYQQWIEQGYVSLSDGSGGNSVNSDDVADWFIHVVKDFGISLSYIGFDPWGSVPFVDRMASQFGEGIMQPIRQGSKTLSAPFQELTAAWKAGLIQIGDNPCTLWTCSNVCVKEEPRNLSWLPEKARGRQRTDGFSALLCAYTCGQEHLEEVKRFS